jgi:hypothetical protein
MFSTFICAKLSTKVLLPNLKETLHQSKILLEIHGYPQPIGQPAHGLGYGFGRSMRITVAALMIAADNV